MRSIRRIIAFLIVFGCLATALRGAWDWNRAQGFDRHAALGATGLAACAALMPRLGIRGRFLAAVLTSMLVWCVIYSIAFIRTRGFRSSTPGEVLFFMFVGLAGAVFGGGWGTVVGIVMLVLRSMFGPLLAPPLTIGEEFAAMDGRILGGQRGA